MIFRLSHYSISESRKATYGKHFSISGFSSYLSERLLVQLHIILDVICLKKYKDMTE